MTMRSRRSRHRLTRALVLLMLAGTLATPLLADVSSVDGNGFSITQARTVEGTSAQDAWTTMTRRIGTWWDPAHTWGGDASKLTLDAKADGCFCEWLPNGGWAEHLRVIHVVPGKELSLRGGLGPLMKMGLAGTMTWAIRPAPEGETPGQLVIEWRYVVGGHKPDGFDGIATAVDGVLGQQLDRLVTRLGSTP